MLWGNLLILNFISKAFQVVWAGMLNKSAAEKWAQSVRLFHSACFISYSFCFPPCNKKPTGVFFFYEAPTDGCPVPFFCSLQMQRHSQTRRAQPPSWNYQILKQMLFPKERCLAVSQPFQQVQYAWGCATCTSLKYCSPLFWTSKGSREGRACLCIHRCISPLCSVIYTD